MKLYTRSGDDGTTGLFGGGRVGKDDLRVEAYGSVDELNASIGLAACGAGAGADANIGVATARLRAILCDLQSRLFDLGADLATPPKSEHESKIARIEAADVAVVERWIDEIDGANAPLRQFVLPGGSELAARLHVARTVCRRAERRVIGLSRREGVNPQAIIYLNRVSDLLFAMARRANAILGVADVPWEPRKRGP